MHLQAIVTKFHGPTNSKGARVSAKAEAGKIMVNWDHGKDVSDNHDAAAKALADKMGWGGHWVAGGNPEGTGYVYVLATKRTDLAAPHFEPAFVTAEREG